MPRIDDAVGIELHPSLADRKGQVEHAARAQKSRQALEAAFKAPGIDRVPVAPQPEVFQGVQAG